MGFLNSMLNSAHDWFYGEHYLETNDTMTDQEFQNKIANAHVESNNTRGPVTRERTGFPSAYSDYTVELGGNYPYSHPTTVYVDNDLPEEEDELSRISDALSQTVGINMHSAPRVNDSCIDFHFEESVEHVDFSSLGKNWKTFGSTLRIYR